ncbi:MAG: AAA family ATPase [Bacteroidota bacterium]
MDLDINFLHQLEKETILILKFCEELNQDKAFIQKINTAKNSSSSNELFLKTEHFFVSDLITLYANCNEKDTPKSQFTLAYYYDVIRNNRFADKTQISKLNQLVTTPDFKNHLEKIKANNKIPLKNRNENYFLISVLNEIKSQKKAKAIDFFQKFINFSFDLNAIESLKQIEIKNSQIDNDSLEKTLEELNNLIGLDNIKKDVGNLINLLEIQKKRTAKGLKNTEINLHTVFLGPPGTGKTTVARLLGRIFKHLGFLSIGHLYETDREGLIAGYVGQTAIKVDKAVEESLGGVLFIDEAYALTQNSLGNDYGAEAVNTLIKRMEDHRDDLALVVAGYTEPMNVFIESNPGLRSRFNRFFVFNHFIPTELFQIFESIAKNADFIISEEAKEKLNDTFELLYENKDEGFGNARMVRNLFEKCIQYQANRIILIPKLNNKTLKTLTEEDIPEPKETQSQVSKSFKLDNTI